MQKIAQIKIIQIHNRHPQRAISLRCLKKNVSDILTFLKLKNAGVEITLVNNAFMKRQNRRFCDKEGTTDVLSFPEREVPVNQVGRSASFKGQFLGDILISLDEAARQARMNRLSLMQEVTFLIIHSILHLTGHDHYTKRQTEIMKKKESRVWKKIYAHKDPGANR